MSIEKALSLVVTAINVAPEGTDTGDLQKFCSAHKVSKSDVEAMCKRGCTDEGAIRTARGEFVHKGPAKKKTAKK